MALDRWDRWDRWDRKSIHPMDTAGSGWTRSSGAESWSPLQRIVDLERFGAALLITSECDGSAWQPGGPFEQGPQLLLPGGKYSVRPTELHGEKVHTSRKRYRDQSMLAVELMAQGLVEAGVPEDCIIHLDCHDDMDPSFDPLREIPLFWSRFLNPVTKHRDALIYYFGFSVDTGAWALTWTDSQLESKVCIIEPSMVLPPAGPQDGVPGARLVVSDAPGTSNLWLRPAQRLRGVAAWTGPALPGASGGPPLARWLAGYMPYAPEGVLAFLDPAPEAGLEDLPCHTQLFWDPLVKPEKAQHLLWELTEFVGATSMRNHRAAATEEILVKGGPQMLLAILAQVTSHEDLAIQVLWLLQALAAEGPTARWADTMNEALTPAMSLPDSLCGGADFVQQRPRLLAAILAFLASCASRCPTCREECASSRWPAVLRLVMAALDTPTSAAAGCRMVAQVAAHRPLDVEEHQAVILKLLEMLAKSAQIGEELTQAAAEALLYTTFRCNTSKLRVLQLLRRHFASCISQALASSSGLCAEKVLTFLRSLASARPPSAVFEAFPEGQEGVVDVVIRSLSRHQTDPGVQRWGLAALGTLCSADERLAQRAVDAGAASSVIWALGADVLSQAKSLEQEALFCAYALLRTESGQAQLGSSRQLPGLAASAVARALRGEPCEAAMWGLRIFERMCQRHAFLIQPYVDVILDAMLAEDCLFGTMVAGSNAVSHLAAVCPTARQKLLARYVQLVKALQSMGHIAASDGTQEGQEKERELMDWVQVLVDILGPPRPVKSDDQIEHEQLVLEEEEAVSAKAVSKSGTKSNSGTKSRTGTKLEATSRNGTKQPSSKEPSRLQGSKGPSRTKSHQ